MIPLSVISCEGCGACCSSMMRAPPFAHGEEVKANLPPEAADAIERTRLWDCRPDDACSWWDRDTKKCRFYEHRPRSCREYEVGGADCLRVRARAGLA